MILYSSFIANQIRFLLQSVNDSNADCVLCELCHFVEYGCDGGILLLQTCLDYINFQEGDVPNMQLKSDLLAGVFRYLLQCPNFSTVFCEAVRNMVISKQYIVDICDSLQLTTSEKVGIGLALVESENVDIKTNGQNFCMGQIEEMLRNSAVIESYEQIRNVIMFLDRSEGLSKHVDSFVQMVYLMEPKERTPMILAPLLSDDIVEARNMDLFYGCRENEFDAILAEMVSETCMADIMSELGHGCTVDASHCDEVLSLFLPLTEATLSRIIGAIARTHTGLEDRENCCSTFYSAIGSSAASESSCLSSWNVDVLVDSIKLLDPFPLHALCWFVWKNVGGQLSFLRYSVSAPPEIFSFAHSDRKLAYANVVPEELTNHAWSSLDHLEVLCQLAERGHAKSVRQILEFPLKQCPKLLLLGIAQILTVYNLVQYEVSSTVFPIIVGDASASGVILQLWHSNPKLVLQRFINLMKTYQGNIVTVLDICQELKILSFLLEQVPFYFSIRLAVVAAQKECINLEKWLTGNIRTQKDVFVEVCLEFLKDIRFTPEAISANSSQHSCALSNFNTETSSTVLKILEANAVQITSEKLSEELKSLSKVSTQVGLRLQNGRNSDSTPPDECSDDIKAEANTYFHQLFSGHLTSDAMVEMLARFRESSDTRERLIFDCMIHHLFEECRFLPRYPETQLNAAAVLVGSLVKHQLLTHLPLDMALHTVLDALRKPPETKIFAFGTLALEQFPGRLVEFPQLCNHILQISHLRGTHPKLVAFIERALARKSSSHLESNGGSASVDPPCGSTPATLEMVQVPDSSWQLRGSSTSQPGQQLSSSHPLQQRHQSFLGEMRKTSASSGIYSKPSLPPWKSSNVLSSDIPNPHKNDNGVSSAVTSSSSSASSASSAFVHSSKPLTSTSMLRKNSHTAGFGSALNIETLVAAAERRDTSVEAPASSIRDKLLFMINNMSSSNVEAKAKEFSEILSEQDYPWFSQYMVMKRASIEPNFHDLYMKFLEKVNSKALYREIGKAAYENCKVLLRSELIKSSSEERSLLKNLGSWLGKFTIGRNQALRVRDLDPKSLIIEAYEKGLMIAVIPFTSKILEACQSSVAYRPPSPWTMAILGLLAEIYVLPNLKMNLKFDIEVLFRNLGVDMKEIKPTSLLTDRVRDVEGNPDFSNRDVGASQPPLVTGTNNGTMSAFSQVELQPDMINSTQPGGHLKLLSQYAGNLYFACGPLMEDENKATVTLSDQLSSGQGLSQVPPSQSPYSVGQLSSPLYLKMNHENIGSHVIFSQKLSALGLQNFQRNVPLAMERGIQEAMAPVVQRSVALATQTTKDLVLKDYAMESDETRIYNAAHLMVASLAGSLANVTCKESLRVSISSQLRNSLQASNISTELQEQAVAILLNDNLDLGCAVIEHAATDKALKTIHNEISRQLSLRRKQREDVGQSYYDASMYTQGPMGVLPEALRPKPGHLSHSQHRVYEEFIQFPKQNLSGKISTAVPAVMVSSIDSSFGPGVSRAYVSSAGQLNLGLSSSGTGSSGLSSVAQPVDLISEEVDSSSTQILGGSSARNAAADGVIPHGVKELGGNLPPFLATSVTEHMAGGISESLFTTAAALSGFSVVKDENAKQSREKKGSDNAIPTREEIIKADPVAADLSGFDDQVSELFVEWYRIYELHGPNGAACTRFVSKLQQSGYCNGDDMSDHFFRYLLELSVAHCLSTEGISSRSSSFHLPQTSQDLSFLAVDVYAKLVVSVLKYCVAENGPNKLLLLPKILSLTTRVIQIDAEEKRASFNPRPYFRLFINWILDLLTPDSILEGSNFQVLIAIANALHVLQPLKVPAFSFAWLELISHWSFMPKLLTVNPPKGWPDVQRLLVDLLKFMEPHLRKAELGTTIHFLYEGTLRVLLVLLHDFPEFLCAYHFSFCDVIPSSCIQMRNVILSASPRNTRLPDPSTPNLKIDLLTEIKHPPRVFSEVDAALRAKQIKSDVDEYLKTRQQGSFLSELVQRLLLTQNEAAEAGSRYNVPLMNSLVLYVGMQTIQRVQANTPHPLAQQINHTDLLEHLWGPAFDIFLMLIVDLDSEGRYLFLNSVANQLRYPNNHTRFFSLALLYLFVEANQEIIQEQITRVLLERLIAIGPHPWGLLVTFIELVKNPKYKFWSLSSTRYAPEIEKLFESVSRSYGGPTLVDESMVLLYGGLPDNCMH